MHENYKPKKCPQCDRRFSTKALLEEHVMRSHNPEGILCITVRAHASAAQLAGDHLGFTNHSYECQILF